MQNIKNNKLAKAITNKMNKKARTILYEDKKEALEELELKVYALAKEINEHSDIETDEITDEEIRNICSKAFKKGWSETDKYRTDHKFTDIFSSKKQTLSKKAAYPFYEMVKDNSPLYQPNDPIGVQSDDNDLNVNFKGVNFGTDFEQAGYFNQYGLNNVDEKELEMGIKVEMEHTTNKEIAKRIALDHLTEISNYYTLLAEMEDKAKEQKTFNTNIKGAENE